MAVNSEDIARLAREFEKCQQILLALGDENRQHLILEMMQMEDCSGVRVGEVTERTHLSRPAVSHPIRILRAVLEHNEKKGSKDGDCRARRRTQAG